MVEEAGALTLDFQQSCVFTPPALVRGWASHDFDGVLKTLKEKSESFERTSAAIRPTTGAFVSLFERHRMAGGTASTAGTSMINFDFAGFRPARRRTQDEKPQTEGEGSADRFFFMIMAMKRAMDRAV